MYLLQYAGYCDEAIIPYVEEDNHIYIDGAYYLYMTMAELAIKKVYLQVMADLIEKTRIGHMLQIKKNNEEIRYNIQEIKEIEAIFKTCRRNDVDTSSINMIDTQIATISNSINGLVARAKGLEKLSIAHYGDLNRTVVPTALKLTFYD